MNKRIRRKIRKRYLAEPLSGMCKHPTPKKLVFRAGGAMAWSIRADFRVIEAVPLRQQPHFVSVPYDGVSREVREVIDAEDAEWKAAADRAARIDVRTRYPSPFFDVAKEYLPRDRGLK